MVATVADIGRRTDFRHYLGDLSGLLPSGLAQDQREFYVPDIIEFTCSDKYLNKPNLYPRQATLLKTIFLQDELFTPYDFDVLGEWAEGFRYPQWNTYTDDEIDAPTTVHYEGEWGINPDVLQRIKILKGAGHRWFSVVCAAQGRRSGKGYLGAIATAYVLWNYICLGNPHEEYGLDPSKRLACQVFAGKKAQARDNQWRDVANVLLNAPCFQEYISDSLSESITVLAPYDFIRAKEMVDRQVESAMNPSTFEIVPKEATTMAARGPASFAQMYDEMAHMAATGVNRSAEEVWDSATPSLEQFHKDSFIYCGSSTWTMQGKFYELVRQSLEIDPVTADPIDPSILTVQLASWDIYLDWEKTQDGDMVASPKHKRPTRLDADGTKFYEVVPTRHFKPLRSAVITYDRKMQLLERKNQAMFRVEFRSKWATALDTYLPAEHVDRAFRAWNGQVLRQLDGGSPGVHDYYAHGDPGKTGSNFGFAVAHIEPDPEGHPIPHVVFDRVHAWTAGDFQTISDDGDLVYEMDYLAIGEQIEKWYTGFLFTDLSFDQWNSITIVQSLSRHGRNVSYKPTRVWERDATAKLNWATAETFKIALALDRVHMPYHELADLELKFLRKLAGDKVDHPDSGPVTTKDVYDAISIVVHKLIGGQIAAAYGEQFSALQVVTAVPGQAAMSRPGEATGAPMSDHAVQQMFSDRNSRPRTSRPVPGQIDRGRPRRR